MDLTRKQFLVLLAGTAAAAACGGSSSPETPSGNCTANGTKVGISQNTGHILVVSKDDIAAGVDKTYVMTGDPSHTHNVTLTADDFATLKKNLGIGEVTTVNNGHSHQITVSCA
jgi:hypothetical protein